MILLESFCQSLLLVFSPLSLSGKPFIRGESGKETKDDESLLQEIVLFGFVNLSTRRLPINSSREETIVLKLFNEIVSVNSSMRLSKRSF